MKLKTTSYLLTLVISIAGLAACGKSEAPAKVAVPTGATMLTFVEYENNVEPYQTRLIVTDRFMRFDDGEGSKDFVLFDRKKDIIYSIDTDEQTVMAVNRQHVEVKPPFELKLEHKQLPGLKDAPSIAGLKPRHYQFSANGEICYDVIAVDGLMPDVVDAMQGFQDILAADSKVTFNNIPADLHNACDMSMSTFAAARHLKFGFPIQEWSTRGDGRSLIDYQENYQPEAGLFDIPKDLKHYTVQEFREGKVSFD